MAENTTEQSDSRFVRQQELLRSLEGKGAWVKYATYFKLSGPGWLQGAITLGGGSLAGALYLGVIMGYDLMWLQPMGMLLGVIMLAAISYVTLSTQERPFDCIRRHISPALAWSWVVATMLANIVWSMPQYALGSAAIQQNLLPGLEGDSGKWIASLSLLVVGLIVVWFYNSGGWGIRVFEWILKAMVAVVVLSFFGVVGAMTVRGILPWGEILAGFVPNPRALFEPAETLRPAIAATGEMASWWSAEIAAKQKENIITAFATAVGINMTFFLPYSMLRKRWGREYRGLAIFDLAIGLIVPYVLATGCVVIAASSQFHGVADDTLALVAAGKTNSKEVKAYHDLLDKRLKNDPSLSSAVIDIATARAQLPEADRRLAAMLAARDNLALANTLEPLVGSQVAQKVFGVGVLGMAISTIIMLMVINGFAVCAVVGAPPDSNVHRWGSLIPCIGVLGPFFWGAAAPALAGPTSMIGGAMLPIAYFSFFLLMNSRTVLGDAMPRGTKRVVWNLLMGTATTIALLGSAWTLYGQQFMGWPLGKVLLIALLVLLAVGLLSFLKHESKLKQAEGK
jgi:Mn2+/Fe2+ NRAMP family transporter